MSEVQRQVYYAECANLALTHYDLGTISIHFVQHNAGIVYRLADAKGETRFLLKIHERAGDGAMDAPEQLTAQMAWLQVDGLNGIVHLWETRQWQT